MTNIVSYGAVETRILDIRDNKVILDIDVAELYGVETKRINEAVSRNIEKFPTGYLLELSKEEKAELVANCDRFVSLRHSTALPKAFTEKGLYMLATILKSPTATKTTIAIIDTFAEIRQINRTIVEIMKDPENEPKQKSLLNKAGTIISRLIMPNEDDLEVIESESSYKINILSSLEFTKKTRSVKKKK